MASPRLRSRGLLVVMVLLAGTITATARAQPWSDQELDQRTPASGVPLSDASQAQRFQASQAFKKGTQRAAEGKHDAALRSFRTAYGLVRSPSARLGVVRALSALGRHLEAYEEGLEMVAEAEQAAAEDPAQHQESLEAGRAQLEVDKAAIALVTIQVTGADEGAVLAVNGAAIDPARWGQPLPVAPGSVQVVLTSSKGEVTESAEVAAGEEIELAVAATVEAPPAEPVVAPPAAAVDEGGYDGPDRILLAAVAGGVGALGFLNFGIFGALTEGQVSRLDSGCPNLDDCDPKLEDEADKGRTYQTLANVSLVVGILGAAAAAGLVTWEILDGEGDASAAATRRWIAVGPASLALGGCF